MLIHATTASDVPLDIVKCQRDGTTWIRTSSYIERGAELLFLKIMMRFTLRKRIQQPLEGRLFDTTCGVHFHPYSAR